MIKLSDRLKKIADYVNDDSSMIDIGCDHGLLDIYLIQKKKNIKLIASDVNPNALNNAKKNIKTAAVFFLLLCGFFTPPKCCHFRR